MTPADWRDSLRALMPDDYVAPAEEAAPAPEKAKPQLRVDVERRKNKVATIISGFEADDERCDEVAAALRKRLATGGSARGGEILLQGDRKADCVNALKQMGYKVK